MSGAVERYGDPLPDEVKARIDHELVIESMGFPAYFLIVWDLISHARERGIRTGPGRGSSAASIVAYCLRITDLDPLRYGLVFERFLNRAAASYPTSTWTSTSATGGTSSVTPPRSTGPTTSPRS